MTGARDKLFRHVHGSLRKHFLLPNAQGPEEMFLSLEHQNGLF